eukprot:2009633-Pleurochrysis_carterae.AAC.3
MSVRCGATPMAAKASSCSLLCGSPSSTQPAGLSPVPASPWPALASAACARRATLSLGKARSSRSRRVSNEGPHPRSTPLSNDSVCARKGPGTTRDELAGLGSASSCATVSSCAAAPPSSAACAPSAAPLTSCVSLASVALTARAAASTERSNSSSSSTR